MVRVDVAQDRQRFHFKEIMRRAKSSSLFLARYLVDHFPGVPSPPLPGDNSFPFIVLRVVMVRKNVITKELQLNLGKQTS